MVQLPQNNDLPVALFEKMLDPAYLTNSYKLYWFFAVFEEIVKGKTEMTFRSLVAGMISRSWHSLLAYRLNLGKSDMLSDLVHDIHKKYSLKPDIDENELTEFILNLKDPDIEKCIVRFYKYVPFRLLTVFFDEDLRGLKDHDKNNIIAELSQTSDRALYMILPGDEKIVMHPEWYNYIYANQAIIRGWLNYKLIHFLQKRNPSVPAIPFKLYPPVKRDLGPAKKFWGRVMSLQDVKDIYTDSVLNPGSISIDHFIPWSFVLHDRLWNLVPTTTEMNSRKSDRLPNLDSFLDKYCRLQFNAFSVAIQNNISKKHLEDYLDIGISDISSHVEEDRFISSLKNRVLPLYQIARNSGFLVWGSYGSEGGGYSVAADWKDGVY